MDPLTKALEPTTPGFGNCQKIGQRVVWEEREGFGVPARMVSLKEYTDQEIEEFIKTNKKPEASFIHFFGNMDSLRYMYEEFEPRDDDICICTYAKSGTTWMQQIIYQLLFGPTEDFDDVTLLSPWLETEFGRTLIPSIPKYPRILKTHLRFEHLPKNLKGKFIFIERDILDVLASYNRHIVGFGVAVTEDSLTRMFIEDKLSLAPYGDYIKSWRTLAPQSLGNNLLSLSYEKIRKDSNLIQSIANFLNIEISEERLKEVERLCSIEYMRGNSRFNHNAERELSLKIRKNDSTKKEFVGNKNSDFSFVGKGEIGGYSTTLSSTSIQLVKEYVIKHGI